MLINNKTIEVLESLTKLKLREEERESALKRMTEIEESFKIFDEIDTQGIAPLIQVPSLSNVMRADVADKMITRESLLSNSPEQNKGYFQVPGTIE